MLEDLRTEIEIYLNGLPVIEWKPRKIRTTMYRDIISNHVESLGIVNSTIFPQASPEQLNVTVLLYFSADPREVPRLPERLEFSVSS